ncbi:MAG TPA: cell wall-binding repeat-containing protein [Coriobacteriia bacterium]|jgi:putative cell wall-binding protein
MKRNGRYRKAGSAVLTAVLLLSQLLVFAAAPAVACDRSWNAEVLAHLGGSSLNKVVVSGGYAYAAANGAFVVFDVGNPAAPKVLSQVPLGGNAEDVALDGSFAYVVGDWGDMQIVDVTTPTVPVCRGTVGWGGAMHGVAVAGDRAYVTSDGHGFKVVDVADKDAPYLVSYAGPPTGAEYYDVALAGGKAFVSYGADPSAVTRIREFDISNLDAAPVKVGNDYSVPGLSVSVSSLVASGSLVFAAEAARGLEVVDFTTPTVPAQRGTHTVAGAGGFDLFKSGSTLYLAAGDSGMPILDVADPAAPSLLGTLAGSYTAVAAAAGKAYLAKNGTLTVADVSNPAAPAALGSVRLVPADAKDVFVSGDYEYVAAGADGLLKVSFDETSGARIVGSYVMANASKVVVTGDFAYVADGTNLRILDVSTGTPSPVGGAVVSGAIEGMAIDGDRLYLAEGSGGMQVMDITARAVPVSLGVYHDPGSPVHAVAADGSRVFIGVNGGTVVSLNAANPAAMTVRDSMGTYGDVLSLSIAGDLLYAGTSQKVYKIDASDPADIFQIGHYYYFGENVVAVKGAGNYAFAATDVGFYLIDFSDAVNPYIATDFGEWTMAIGGLDTRDNVVFLAARDAGFYAVRVPVVRTSGTTRYDTSVEMSKANWTSANYVVLATGANYADAACAAPLANERGGPLMLVHPLGISGGVLAEIQRLAEGAGGIGSMNVVIAGSAKVVPASVETALRGLGIPSGNIQRLAGADRYDTARMIAHEFKVAHGSNPATAFVATGDNFPDALTVSGLAAYLESPVLLVKKTYAPPATQAAFDDLGHPALIAVGGESVVSAALYNSLGCVDRISGSTRYGTAKEIAMYALEHGFGTGELIVTTGVNFPDALVSGVVAAKRTSPVLLANTELPDDTSWYIGNYKSDIKKITVVGSSKAVSQNVEDQIIDQLVW